MDDRGGEGDPRTDLLFVLESGTGDVSDDREEN